MSELMDSINQFIVDNKNLSYEELSNHTGLSMEAIRSRYRRLRKKYPTLPIKRTVFVPDSPESFQQRVSAQKEKLLNIQTQTQAKREAIEEARFEILTDVLKTAITPLVFEYEEDFVLPEGESREEAMCVILSDLHFGKKTSTYNIEIALERFSNWTDEVILIAEQQRNNHRIFDLHIFMTGDIVDGESIYPTHPHHMDSHVVNQVFQTAPVFVNQLVRLSQVFKSVHVHSVRGNHGRLSKFANENANWDTLYANVLKIATQHVPNLKWNITDDWHQVVNVNGVEILQYHGHQIKMTLNLPWYGITTRISRWASTRNIRSFDVALQGHFHCSSSLMWNDIKVITNGTMVSGDAFALEMLGLESSECQRGFFVHPERKITLEFEIKF
jgi:predicted phosphodiesterase